VTPVVIALCALTPSARSQQSSGTQMVDMNSAGMFLMGLSSGTSMNPPAWPMPMVMRPFKSWNTMFMAQDS